MVIMNPQGAHMLLIHPIHLEKIDPTTVRLHPFQSRLLLLHPLHVPLRTLPPTIMTRHEHTIINHNVNFRLLASQSIVHSNATNNAYPFTNIQQLIHQVQILKPLLRLSTCIALYYIFYHILRKLYFFSRRF